MLKRYAAPERISWSGRAWEIRHALRQEIRNRGRAARLADLLPAARPPLQAVPPSGGGRNGKPD
ncbi:Z-ring formation inhibitor MciZ [Cohnella caldifontis]|uniref:Z-ring formation inhibitor MciZ n=1 Tax=Cohnella caldifontis TaxID=3027471 RepID=UPI0023EAE408|nr:Z-ring formation inhibitor MciZ [Cohnella sp. YIM B05605]